MAQAPFWKTTPLDKMTPTQWESLCDGCAKCCLHKLQDEETDIVYYTNVACQLLDVQTCRCTDYANRLSRVPECLVIDHCSIEDYYYLPSTCAYRLLAEGKDLHDWHPLQSGSQQSVHDAGISIRGRAIINSDDVDLQGHLVDWPL